MIRDGKIVAELDRKARSQKKISRYNEGAVEKILAVINFVNNMDEFDVEIWDGHYIDDVTLPNEFKDFVKPASIRYDSGDRRSKDLLLRQNNPNRPSLKKMVKTEKKDPSDPNHKIEAEKPKNVPISYSEYVYACDDFRANFKKDTKADMPTFASLRKHVNLGDIIDRVSVGGKVNYEGSVFVPIEVSKIVGSLFDDRYFHSNADKVLQDYIAKINFN